MKVLVTGGQGFIGYNLIARLLEMGCNVCSIDDLSTGCSEYKHDGCEYYKEDIVNSNIEFISPNFDVVFHLAALSRIQPSFDDPVETFRVNTEGTLNVCEYCYEFDVKMIYAGSSSQWHNPYQSPYAISKKMGEDVVKMYKEVWGMNSHIVRFYNVYGQYELMFGEWAAVIGKWRGQVLNGEPITVVGDGSQSRDFTHVDDVVDALIKVMETNEEVGDAWEVGRGESFEIREVAQMFVDKFGCEVVHIGEQKGNYRHTLRENDDALYKLGWEPKKNLKDYIEGL